MEKHNLWTLFERSVLMFLFLPATMAVMPMQVRVADDPNDDIVILDGVSYHVLRNNDDWERFRPLRFICEWDGCEVNIGADCRLFKYFLVQCSLQRCSQFSGGLCLYIPLL